MARHGCTWPVQSDVLELPFVSKATRRESRELSLYSDRATGRNFQQGQGTSLRNVQTCSGVRWYCGVFPGA